MINLLRASACNEIGRYEEALSSARAYLELDNNVSALEDLKKAKSLCASIDEFLLQKLDK